VGYAVITKTEKKEVCGKGENGGQPHSQNWEIYWRSKKPSQEGEGYSASHPPMSCLRYPSAEARGPVRKGTLKGEIPVAKGNAIGGDGKKLFGPVKAG